MKQIIQDLRTGETSLEKVPVPSIRPGNVLVQTTTSLISLGTEKMLVEFGKASYIQKARQQPEKVKQVIEKIKSDGLLPTIEAVFNKLNQPLPLGYCNVGTVVEVGAGVGSLQVGDRVVSNGNHAEFVLVPENLTAKVPENVTDEEAVFTVIGSIGLQGIRLVKPTFGETIVVFGLGLIGLLTIEMLRANGCRVIGVDIDDKKIQIAKNNHIAAYNPANGDDIVRLALTSTDGVGADAVIITATSKNDEIVHQSAQMLRKKGRIVLVGDVNLNIRRSDFYEKELSFQVSCSYGPGRYDPAYEEKGIDYPIPFVRWTEKRNFNAFLHALSSKQIDVVPLITGRYKLEEFHKIYNNLGTNSDIATLLLYDNSPLPDKTIKVFSSIKGSEGCLAIIGAGNYTSATVAPALKKVRAKIKYVSSAKGLTSKVLAKKLNASFVTTDYKEILKDPDVSLCLITTRHDLHAEMVVNCLNAGKHTFVEKPLCITPEELDEITNVYNHQRQINNISLTVGFNRRFSPLAIKMKQFAGNGEKNIIATMNAGYIPKDSWVHDLEIGGGRIIGEACHFIDLCTFLAGSKVAAVCMNALGKNPNVQTDNASILLKYEDGTNAVINYFANGSKAYSKERIELYSNEKTLVIDNWRSLQGFGVPGFRRLKTKQDKGHLAQFKMLNRLIEQGGNPLIPFEEIHNVTQATFAALDSLRTNKWIFLK